MANPSYALEVHCAVTKPGDEVKTVGAHPALGSWDVHKALALQTSASSWPTWLVQVPLLPAGTEFKLVICRSVGGVAWEPFDGNRRWPSCHEGDGVRCTYGDPRVGLVHAGVEDLSFLSPVTSLRGTRVLSVADFTTIANLEEEEEKGEEDQLAEFIPAKRTASFSPCHTNFIFDNRGNIRDFYELDASTLGSGTFGCVSKALNKVTGSTRAIKTIHKMRIGDVDAFKQEVSIMKLMDHPNVIKLFEFYEDPKNMYLVMELCTGGDLFDRIIAEHKFSEVQARIVMRQILRGIYYMHEKGVIHRDLKPENFLFSSPEGLEASTLKIIDFGLSCRFTKGVPVTTKLGTPIYVAPEVLTGRYCEKADLWGCGIIMYILLCGYPPFNGSTDAEILRKVKLGRFSFDASNWGRVSDEAKRLVGALLNVNVFERFGAAEALEDPWLKEGAAQDVQDAQLGLGQNLVDNLRHYRSQNSLKKAALQLIAWRFLTEDRIETLKDLFRSLDTNGDGVLSLEEIQEGLLKFGLRELPADLQQVVAAVDADGSGSIDYTEFLAATLSKLPLELNEDVLQAAFRLFDKDGDGKIDAQELKGVLQPDDSTIEKMGLSKGAADAALNSKVRELMSEVDQNGDGRIDFQEFVHMMRGTLAAKVA